MSREKIPIEDLCQRLRDIPHEIDGLARRAEESKDDLRSRLESLRESEREEVADLERTAIVRRAEVDEAKARFYAHLIPSLIVLLVAFVYVLPRAMPATGAFLASQWSTVRGGAEAARTEHALPAGADLHAAVAESGGILQLGEGTYRLSRTLRPERDVRIRGGGAEVSRIVIDADGPAIAIDAGSHRLSGVAIERAAGSGSVIAVSGGSLELGDTHVSGGVPNGADPGAGLLVSGRADVSTENATILDSEFGVVVRDQARASIRDSTVRANRKRGVSLHGRSEVDIHGSDILSNGFGDARDDFWQGIATEDGSRLVLRSTRVSRSAGVAVQLRDESYGDIRQSTFEGNGANMPDVAPPDASAGAIAIGVRGTDQRPEAELEDNEYANNFGGNVNDYR